MYACIVRLHEWNGMAQNRNLEHSRNLERHNVVCTKRKDIRVRDTLIFEISLIFSMSLIVHDLRRYACKIFLSLCTRTKSEFKSPTLDLSSFEFLALPEIRQMNFEAVRNAFFFFQSESSPKIFISRALDSHILTRYDCTIECAPVSAQT